MKRILGLDLGTNSIGWAMTQQDFKEKKGEILGIGSRIIPMDAKEMGKFDSGQSISQTADRTRYRGTRRLYQRDNLRRERLHRVLHILGFLPNHYADGIDFEKNIGQFKPDTEPKLNYFINENGKHEFLFKDSFEEMVEEFKKHQPQLIRTKEDGKETKIPYDWTIYYLRKKALEQAITKEELAWLILNFNQKRGYYQLRGEDIDEDKNKQFVQLKVKEIVDSGEKVKDKILYDVYFENGWKYDKQVVKTEDWSGGVKEFIVTTKTLKDGDIKRTYKAVDSEQDWAAIKAKTEQDIEHSNKTVGQFIYETLLQNPTLKIRGKLVKTIERKFYKQELKAILSKQLELHPELFNAEIYKACIEELYHRNEAHQNQLKDKSFVHLFLEDIIFYQRPLKSQKSNISGCQYETRTFVKEDKNTGKNEKITQAIPVISKSHPLFQEFRLWQWLHNLRIYEKEQHSEGKTKLDVDVTSSFLRAENDRVELFDYLTARETVEQKNVIDYFIKKGLIDKKLKDNYRWNYVEDKPYPCFETKATFARRLSKVIGVKDAVKFLTEKTAVGNKQISGEEQLWHIVYSVSDAMEYESALEKFALKHDLDKDSFVDNFKKYPPFKSDYAAYSMKALNRIVPLMRQGDSWQKQSIPQVVRDRYSAVQERIDALKLTDNLEEKTIKARIAEVSDDDIPKQIVRSFINTNENPLSGLNTYQACYLIYDRHSEIGEIQNWKTPEDIDKYLKDFKQHSLRNPIVEQVVTETLRVVRDIWQHYGSGAENFFDEIHVELGREMKNPAEKRKRMSSQNTENENTNQRIKEILKELINDPSVDGDIRDYSPSHQELLKIYEEGVIQNPEADFSKVSEDDIVKIRKNSTPSKNDITRYKLWLEQGYISPYTGQIIQLSRLFTPDYQIEHIIPQSRYFDNSLSNKIICESTVNEDKSNKTAAEYLKEKGGSIIHGYKLMGYDQYQQHVNKYFRKNKTKLTNLLSEEIPEGFINRQLNDSRYISKLVKGLLSNIVRQNGEQEATAKNLIPVTGAVTSKLKHDWGLNDVWNQLILPRFERLNSLTQTNDYTAISTEGHIIPTVPDDLSKGFNKKRVDHRHHALDALVVACTSREHTNYLSALNAEKDNYSLKDKLLIKNKHGDYTKHFQKPWADFPRDAQTILEKTVISFKQNLRVINKTNNKFWSYKDENGNLNLDKDGKPKKKLRKQTEGDNWAIRKALHKETVSGLFNIDTPKGKVATSVRTALTEIKNQKQIDKVTDISIRDVILPNHLKNYLDDKGIPQFDIAFSEEGIENLNNNITALNNGKPHQPIKKLKMYEVGSKFAVGEYGNKSKKYVEAAKGTNLFFAIYWDEKKQKRNYETIPLNEVIAHQKQVAHLPKNERTPIQPNSSKGQFLFTLSPNDLVYVPTEEEMENPNLADFDNATKDQNKRVYKMVSCTGSECHFIPSSLASLIKNYDSKSKFGELGSLNKQEKTLDNQFSVKERCWKLFIDRLGNISKA